MLKNKKEDSVIKLQLAEKNFQLKVESALEKVRVVAMQMKEPADMLKICKIISEQLTKLGVKEIRNVQTAIIYEKKGFYRNFEYYTKHKKTFITDVDYSHPVQKKNFSKMLEGRGAFLYTQLQGKKLKDWYAYQKTTNVFIDRYLEKAPSLNYYWHSLGPLAVGISTYQPLAKNEQVLFTRFINVFELAYRRYIDIEKAEEQAREVEIELALEKVRAQALSMRKPADLLNVCKVLFKELLALGFTQLRNTIIHRYNDEQGYFIDYDYSDLTGSAITNISYDANSIIKKFVKQIRRSDNAFAEITIKGTDLKSWKELEKKEDNQMIPV